jgi:hypothetical protein
MYNFISLHIVRKNNCTEMMLFIDFIGSLILFYNSHLPHISMHVLYAARVHKKITFRILQTLDNKKVVVFVPSCFPISFNLPWKRILISSVLWKVLSARYVCLIYNYQSGKTLGYIAICKEWAQKTKIHYESFF